MHIRKTVLCAVQKKDLHRQKILHPRPTETTVRPITLPEVKLTVKAAFRPLSAAMAVRVLEYTAIIIPTNPQKAEVDAPAK